MKNPLTSFVLRNEVNKLKNVPGCYLMKDENDEIIYIGKAKSLKKRVGQYFLNPQKGKTRVMVSHVDHFETIITNNEKEAFILEMNLIQKHKPKYNILLKDDKHYPYIAIHKDIKDPYVSIARNTKDKKCEYFGPYPNSTSAYEVVNIINSISKLRKCKDVPKTPCLYYHLDQCLAPCMNKIDPKEYKARIKKIHSFLNGNNEYYLSEIKKKIEYYSEKLNYEEAAIYKKMYDSVEYINQKQAVEFIDRINKDYIAFYSKGFFLSVVFLIYRNGILLSKKTFFYEIVEDVDEFLTSLVGQYYLVNAVPREIYISSVPVITFLHGTIPAKIIFPKKGRNLEIIAAAYENAKDNYTDRVQNFALTDNNEKLLRSLGRLINIDPPNRIEVFDNSHLQGTNAVGAMVVFVNGEEDKSLRRKYNIQSQNKKDDLSSMYEVLMRRYKRLIDEKEPLPDLIILDGGRNQLEIGNKVLNELKISLNLVGLVKDDKHRTRAIMNSDYLEFSILDKDLFHFLTRMQDTVHNYAISTHINKRSNSMFKSVFDDIKGIGPKRKDLIISKYPTLKDLKEAKVEDLSQFIPKDVAEELIKKVKEEKYDII